MSPSRLSRLESAARVILAFNEAANRHDVTAMMALTADDCLFENAAPAPDGTTYRGKEAIARFWEDFFRQSPQAHFQIEEIFGLGFRCVMRWRCDWVDQSGEPGHIRGVDIFRVERDLIRERLSYVKA